jgi:hypothetical protein
MTELCELAYKYRTDKCPQICHSYTPFYYELFKDRRHSIKKVLEIGIGSREAMAHVEGYIPGASLRMWRDFFPNAMIYGIDIDPGCLFEEDRIQTFLCDIHNEEHVKNLLSTIGNDIDLIIDDSLHGAHDQLKTFNIIKPLIKNLDFNYIIEDAAVNGGMTWLQNKIRNLNFDVSVPSLDKIKLRICNRLIIISKPKKEKGIIYYTDNRAREFVLLLVQKILNEISKEKDLPITAVSLKPINFGNNIVLENRERSYPTMVRQIIMALENSQTRNVFFCENDVLYHQSHFDFIPPKDNVFYYNSNVWRWRLWDDHAIRYDKMWPLSCLCCNREFALAHYKMREQKIIEWGENEFRSREPRRARIWGYEPGTKLKRRGGLTNDVAESWYSEFPNIDMRHARTFSRLKCTQEDFNHAPENWEEIDVFKIPGWDLEELLGEEQLKYIRETCTKW